MFEDNTSLYLARVLEHGFRLVVKRCEGGHRLSQWVGGGLAGDVPAGDQVCINAVKSASTRLPSSYKLKAARHKPARFMFNKTNLI